MFNLSLMFLIAFYLLVAFVLFITIAHTPVVPIIRIMQHDVPDKKKIIRCFITAYLKVLITIPIDLVAPIVVPVALLFTKTSDNRLPHLFWMWDNDVSINGDIRKENSWDLLDISNDLPNQSEIDKCYWAKGHHPRSFYARWVWLGLRNRASALSLALGTTAKGDYTEWSDAGWNLRKIGGVYRYFELLPIGNFYIRMHCGYKIPIIPNKDKASVVSIGFSLRNKDE